MVKKKIPGWLVGGIFIILGAVMCLPVLMLVSGSLADALEWKLRTISYMQDSQEYINWRWIPDYPTLEHYRRLLFLSPAFFKLFWNSVGMTAGILLGQLLVAVPAAWAFAVYRFRGKEVLFSLYVILMLLPFQVTMLSKYLVLQDVGLMDTRWAVVLPAIFSTFPVFLIYRSFAGIPQELLEAARVDGAGEWQSFVRVGLPAAQGGILAAMILSFLESWNMMEEPLTFLQDKSLWPLSLYLPEIAMDQAGYACAASVITLTVSLFIFAIFHDALEQGIITSGLKA
ncbi:MAG: carbohydrate ABC transporter permease [Acetatifactor sp.]|nr:carbohydrate ABC transporter permease [Acetatifactor sp.]